MKERRVGPNPRTQFSRTTVYFLQVWRSPPVRHGDGGAQRNLEIEFHMVPLWRRLHLGQLLEPFLEVPDRLPVGRALLGPLARLVQIMNRALILTCLREVMGKQFRLRLDDVGKLRFELLGDDLMKLLPALLQ